jgi:hypothetical protein
MSIEDLVVDLSKDPFNPELNFKCALEYERVNQTASAVSFYLRTAEYGRGLLVYNSLLKLARCFEDQNDRINTVSNCILQAIAYMPKRPEAYFMMSQFHERLTNWQESYTYAKLGLVYDGGSMIDDRYEWEQIPNLPGDIGYHGRYCLQFQQAISAWWIGRKEESEQLLLKLSNMNLSEEYANAVRNNMERLNVAI